MQLKNKSIKKIDGDALRIGIVVSRFNERITEQLLQSATQALTDSKVKAANIKLVSVAGAMEIPFALQELARRKKYHCLIALGCVIRGETPHFEYVCKTAQEGVLRVSLDHSVPIGFGVMTVNTMKQARARVHLGYEAATAALELTKV